MTSMTTSHSNPIFVPTHQDHYLYLIQSLGGIIQGIKDGIAENDLAKAKECWDQLEDWQKIALWKAPTKGGVFTTHEREVIKSSEFRKALWMN